MMIVVEGLDGTGKTTTCDLLARKLNATLYRTPPKILLEEREAIDRFATDEEHYRFYLRGVQIASRELAALNSPRVIIDRYWMTTVAYHRAMGLTASRQDFGDITEPDTTIFLTVDPAVQIHRLVTRGLSTGDVRAMAQFDLVRAAYEAILADHPNVIRIDTTLNNPTKVLEAILQNLPLA